MSSDVFIISSSRNSSLSAAIRAAVESAGVASARVRDTVFSFDLAAGIDLESVVAEAGLQCPAVSVGSNLRGLMFSAASILSDDADLTVVAGVDAGQGIAVVLASPEVVGLHNLMPRARLAARSLAGTEGVYRIAGITASDVQICKEGDSLLTLDELIEELEVQSAQLAIIAHGEIAVLIERV